MKRALFKSHNLLGDGLYVGNVAEQWYKTHGHEYDEIHVYVLPGYTAPTYEYMNVPWKIVHEPEGEYDFVFNFDVNVAFQISSRKNCHLVESYAEMLGVQGPFIKRPNYDPPKAAWLSCGPKPVLMSMFSMSCASRENPPKPPNKMLPWAKWKPIVELLRKEYPNNPIKLLGAKEDKLPSEVEKELGFDWDSYVTGVPIAQLGDYMRHSELLVTVDNGMGHLASAVGLNEFLLVPACLTLTYIVPWGHPGLRLVHIDPPSVDPSKIVLALRGAIADWKEEKG